MDIKNTLTPCTSASSETELLFYQSLCPTLKYLPSLEDNFKEMADDLFAKKNMLSSTQFRYALEVILALGLLNYHRESISKISDESQRNDKITKLTGLIAEPGLVTGCTPNEILNSLEQRTDQLKITYLADKENDDTISLWRDGFMGPPCFNGRVITLQEYRYQKQLLTDRSNIDNLVTVSDQTDYDQIAILMVELMYQCNDNEVPEKSEFKKFIESSGQKEFLVEYDKLYRRAAELYV